MSSADSPDRPSDLATRWADITDRIDRACRESGRDRDTVRLLPVSKTHPSELIRQVYAAGARRFGESKAQEVQAKAAELGDELPGLEWSVIGHLQTNKAKVVAELATEFQALDSAKIGETLQRRLETADRTLDVLIQVNTSGETSKYGLDAADVPAVARELATLDRLRVRGLMTLAANDPDPAVAGRCFTALAELGDRLRADDVPGDWSELSMGMSGDFETAIAHGSTCVRIGSALFGARDYS